MNTTAFAEWLRRKLDERGLRQSQVASYLDIDQSAVSRWLKGINRPDPESLGKLTELFNVRTAKLYELANYPSPDYEPPERQDLSPDEVIRGVLNDFPVPVTIENQMASAGGGQIVQERIWLERTRASKGARAIRVRGYSMDPEVHDGDLVVFDHNETAYDGNLVVATVDNEMFVKRYRRKSDHFVLEGNDGRVLQLDQAQLEGKVIQIIRDV